MLIYVFLVNRVINSRTSFLCHIQDDIPYNFFVIRHILLDLEHTKGKKEHLKVKKSEMTCLLYYCLQSGGNPIKSLLLSLQ